MTAVQAAAIRCALASVEYCRACLAFGRKQSSENAAALRASAIEVRRAAFAYTKAGRK